MIFKINVENSNRFVRDRMILVEFNIEIAFNKITKKRYKKSTNMESTSEKNMESALTNKCIKSLGTLLVRKVRF